ncbi:hypothetical protein HELRODRAFT_193782 [Helobdella robusta]|uniref:Uncharacterized protein n=1 Tax=Helobdella robusta TaxID=6412 RepID=T1FVC7_HELRO|nr:hypothetical protein HELRODRAFT_193782 [Helobdella robusta]ESN94773.1 hypothetical protein HELRODRAFT_193782 [Helobdella robusta]
MTVRKPEPAEISFRGFRFLITDRPTDIFMDKYIDELKKHNATEVIRVCDPTYDTTKLINSGISVTDLPFDDGTGPPNEIVDKFFEIVKNKFKDDPESCVAVHCVAGLGRAPVMVAIALVELGMKYEDAVEMIRKKRRGAINAKQLCFLEKYKPKHKLKKGKMNNKACLIM